MARISYVKSARVRRNPDGTEKPPKTCDKCGHPIVVGQPYKHMSIKTRAYSSRELVRCNDCPTWHVWEYSNSLSARLAEIEHNARTAIEVATDQDEAESALSEAADAVREIAEEKREGAQNIEDGFGHATSASEELNEIADNLDSWADEISSYEVPEYPDPEEAECEECDGSGVVGEEDCGECNGSGHPDDPTEEQLEDWREETVSVLDNCPV